ncbi:Immunoglobulin superfamily member 10 [Holothuria leucospilota]|uniref:Immunoglobulin superfamily member 10 n=1 Tax=Holothuria leucospilota TaxID=206669 RepID=A0A9Q0YPP0_HOLLE|nr:Immunoglobulin superfamily member 10 [Holothuria leucospilota]
MNGDVNIKLKIKKFLCLLLLVLINFAGTVEAAAISCPNRCQCWHTQLVCGGAVRGSPLKTITSVPVNIDKIGTRIDIGNFSRNSISVLHEKNFVGLEKARILDLSHNDISVISDGAFEMAASKTSLKILYLSFNRIQELRSEMFRGLSDLWQLYLGHNDIHVIKNDAFLKMHELHMISLRYSLRHWNYSIKPFKPLAHLKMMYVAQTKENSCTCGFFYFMNDVISRHINVIDEADATMHCTQSDISCETRDTSNYDLSTPSELLLPIGVEELIPPVSENGIITYEGKSYSLYVPEGQHLLMVYDMDVRRRIAHIQQRVVRDHYERLFRMRMREILQKTFHQKSLSTTKAKESTQTTSSNPIFITTKPTTNVKAKVKIYSPLTKLDHVTTLPAKPLMPPQRAQSQVKQVLKATTGKPMANEGKSMTKEGKPMSTEGKPTTKEAVNMGVTLALIFTAITLSFFLFAFLMATMMGFGPCSNAVGDESGQVTNDKSGCFRCCDNITSKLAIRRAFINSRGETSSPKKGFSTLHNTAKSRIDEKRKLQATSSDPLPEEAIQALTREQRRRTLGGQSRASSERTGFDSDSDSDHELFMR